MRARKPETVALGIQPNTGTARGLDTKCGPAESLTSPPSLFPNAYAADAHIAHESTGPCADSGRPSGIRKLVHPEIDETIRPRISAIIPTLNEAENLPHVFARLPEDLDEVIIVDGLSTDDTVEVARMLRPDVRVVLQNGRGKGNALACGFAAARGEIIVMLDADGSTNPAEIPTFIQPLLAGADFVKGSRYLPHGGSDDITPLRSLGNRALSLFVNVLFRTKYTDLCYGYSAFWRDCLPKLQITCDGFEVETVLNVRACKARLRVVEVPSHELVRIHGTSNLSAWRDGQRVIRTILAERLSPLPRENDDWRPAYRECLRSGTQTITLGTSRGTAVV